MDDFKVHSLLATQTTSVWDVVCRGTCKHKSAEECAAATHLIFPYRGIYVHHAGSAQTVAEPNQVVFLNECEPYRISHPLSGGDSTLSISVNPAMLSELAPAEFLLRNGPPAFNRTRVHIDGRTQSVATLLRLGLKRGLMGPLEAESLTLTLVRRALGKRISRVAATGVGRQKLVDRAKLVLSSDLGRRWTLGDVAAEVGVSPVYLTHVFRQIEGLPLYKYQLQLRLARALDLLADCGDLTRLALDLGFSSHSHFSAAFKRAYEQTPAKFQQSVRAR